MYLLLGELPLGLQLMDPSRYPVNFQHHPFAPWTGNLPVFFVDGLFHALTKSKLLSGKSCFPDHWALRLPRRWHGWLQNYWIDSIFYAKWWIQRLLDWCNVLRGTGVEVYSNQLETSVLLPLRPQMTHNTRESFIFFVNRIKIRLLYWKTTISK